VLESLEDFQEYREAWDMLHQECGAPIFSSYDLVHLWLDVFKAVVKPHIVLIEDRGELIGAAPMFTSQARVMGLPVKTLAMVGNLDSLLCYSLYNVFAKNDDPEVIREMLNCVKRAKWNRLTLTHMEPNKSTLRFLEGAAQMWERQYTSPTPDKHRTYVFPTEGNIAGNFGKSTRANLHRLRNKLEKEGRMDLRKVESVEEAERAMNLYLSLHEERWDASSSSMRLQDNCRFTVEIGKMVIKTGKGEINELLIDGEVAAQLISLFDGDVVRGFRVGMTDKFQKFSPGLMVIALSMEENRKMGFKVFDPGHGKEDYKLRITNDQRELGSAMVYTGTMNMIYRVRSFPPVKALETRLKLPQRLAKDAM